MTARRPAPPDAPVSVLTWAQFLPYFAARYKVSSSTADHVTIIGPNGTGKTVLAMAIAELRRYVVVLGCKPRDDELSTILRKGRFYRQTAGELPHARAHPRVAVWPPYRGVRDRAGQRAAFEQVFDTAFNGGGWHIVCEEAPHLVAIGMRDTLTQHLRMARSSSSGLIMCTQRPRGLPLEAISAASHLFLFGTNDDDDLKRLSGMNGVSSRQVREIVGGLGRSYDFLHVDTRTGALTVSKYDRG